MEHGVLLALLEHVADLGHVQRQLPHFAAQLLLFAS